MGKKTYYSLPVRPLPNRRNIVITDIPCDTIDGCVMAYSIEEAVALCDSNDESFVIGGGIVYNQFIGIADTLYITRVHGDFDGDTFFPEIDKNQWTLRSEETVEDDPQCGLSYTYEVWVRK
jgi:dihydrofolate reductase